MSVCCFRGFEFKRKIYGGTNFAICWSMSIWRTRANWKNKSRSCISAPGNKSIDRQLQIIDCRRQKLQINMKLKNLNVFFKNLNWKWKCEYLCESERRHHPPGCDWHGPEVQVVPNCVLEVVVNSPFREPRVQVLAQVGRYRTWKSEWTIRKSTIIIFQRFSFFLNLYWLTSSDESNAEKLINITFQTLFQCFAWLVAQIPMNINNANKIPIHIWCKLTLDSFRKK